MKRYLSRTIQIGLFAGFGIGLAGCDTAVLNSVVDGNGPLPDPISEEFRTTRDVPPTTIEDDCPRRIQLSNGATICVDELAAILQLANVPDEDGDGIPNLNDDDIDGDGIPNSHDPDIDGDGLFNGIDDDVDADGVPNERDADVDGDFIRNRWDLDIDGDLVYNPYDRDADGDGFDDEDDARDDDDASDSNDSDEDETGDESQDDVENDDEFVSPFDFALDGMNSPAMPPTPPPLPPGPTGAERQAIDAQNAAVLETDADAITAIHDLFVEVDPQRAPEDYLDGLAQLFEDTMADNPPAATEPSAIIAPVSVAVREDVPVRVAAVLELAAIEPDLPELIDGVDLLADTARAFAAAIDDLVATSIAYGQTDATPNVREAVAVGVDLHEVAHANEIDHEIVDELTPPLVAIARAIDVAAAEADPVPIFGLVAALQRDFQDEQGNGLFATLSVVRMLDRLSQVVESPTEELLLDSASHLLEAADVAMITDLVALVDAFDDAMVDPTDGISMDEADAAAAIIVADGVSSN